MRGGTIIRNALLENRLEVDPLRCDGCGGCVAVCPEDALLMPDSLVEIIRDRCTLCLNCLVICPVKAFRVQRS